MNGTKSTALKRTAISQAGRLGAHAGDDLAQEPGAVLEAAAVAAGPVHGAQELVTQVAVAVLDVDEVEARRLREPRGASTKSSTRASISSSLISASSPSASYGGSRIG